LAKKILVIRFSSIGDIVLTTPVIRALHQQLDADVHYLTKSSFASIIQSNPHVAKVITLSDNIQETIRELQAEQYDHIIDLHHNLRTKRIKMALGRPSSSFYKLNFEKWLRVRFGINTLPDLHIVDRYIATTVGLGVKKDAEGLDFFIPQHKKVDVQKELDVTPVQYVSIVIGAAHLTKCLTTEQIIRLCHLLKMPVVLLGGKDESVRAQHIVESMPERIKNACGGFDILQSASILQQSASIITHDTGLMHIAAALKKPQVVIWGNTIPQFGMYPYYGQENIPWISFEQKELSCRPCSKLGFEQCPKGHFRCILDHDLQKIAEAALSLYTI
jgi:ADP-heptose:LPS heptosyltransferase